MKNFKKITPLQYLDGIRNDLKQSIDDIFDYLIDSNQRQDRKISILEEKVNSLEKSS